MKPSGSKDESPWYGYLPVVGIMILAMLILLYALPSIAQATAGI